MTLSSDLAFLFNSFLFFSLNKMINDHFHIYTYSHDDSHRLCASDLNIEVRRKEGRKKRKGSTSYFLSFALTYSFFVWPFLVLFPHDSFQVCVFFYWR